MDPNNKTTTSLSFSQDYKRNASVRTSQIHDEEFSLKRLQLCKISVEGSESYGSEQTKEPQIHHIDTYLIINRLQK